MTTRSRLDEIEDYHFAVDNFIHKGKSADIVVDLLRERGADEQQIISVFKLINENYQGARLLETGKMTRSLNFLIDTSVVCVLWYLIFSRLSADDRASYSLLIVILVPLTYYSLFEGLMGRTPGKFITGSIVVNKDGKKPDLLKILIRTACRFFPHTAFSAFFRDRIFHDKISRTYVVDKQRWTSKYETI